MTADVAGKIASRNGLTVASVARVDRSGWVALGVVGAGLLVAVVGLSVRGVASPADTALNLAAFTGGSMLVALLVAAPIVSGRNLWWGGRPSPILAVLSVLQLWLTVFGFYSWAGGIGVVVATAIAFSQSHPADHGDQEPEDTAIA
ncbi:MAG TPA: hypothetical protein VEA69_08020 [Tepidisphaeraceae bacterium]|nr:hypothetical protein [Tepidisphaeraceae bacterium]